MPRGSRGRNHDRRICQSAERVLTMTAMPLPSLVDEIDRLFDELIRRPWSRALHQVAPFDIRAVDDGWIIELPVEGLEADDLEVHVQGRRLTVTGQRTTRQEGRPRRAMQTHREVSLHRTFSLPIDAEPEDIDTSVEGATLTIHVRGRQPWRKQTNNTSEKK